MPVTDVHNHAMPMDVLELFEHDPSFGVSVAGGTWDGVHHGPFPVVASFHDVDAKLADLDRVGIEAAILSPPPLLFFYEIDGPESERVCVATNAGMADMCARSGGRLTWLANLPVQDPDRAVDSYRAAVGDGARGAALGTSVAGRRLDEPDFERFWAVAAEIGLPVLLHPAFNEPHAALEPWYLQNVIGNPVETTLAAQRLLCAGVLDRYPALRLVLLHGGGFLPYQLGRLRHARAVRPELADTPADVLGGLSQMYFDTITHDDEALRFLVSQVGEDHVLLGTDMPFDMAMQTPMESLGAALPEDVVRRVSVDNVDAVFGPVRSPAGQPSREAPVVSPGRGVLAQ